MRIFYIIYSLLCYAIGVATLVGLILFIGDLFIAVTINQGSDMAPGFSGPMAIGWNLILIAAWGYIHSLMADPRFKKKWTKIIPIPIERSTYLLGVAIMTAFLILFWAPLPEVIWNLNGTIYGTVLWIMFFAGWIITLLSTFMINHFHLFGLQQAFRGISKTQSKAETFQIPLFYKFVRHPIMTGVFIALWSATEMTVGRLIIAIGMTVYIFAGIRHEEKTLIADLGEEYIHYKNTTPSVIPGLKY